MGKPLYLYLDLYLYRNAVEWFRMVLRAVPAVLGWKKKQENLAGFLEKGILAQYHKYFANVLQLFWHKYMQCVDANIWMAYKHVWHIITFTETRTKQDFPQSVRAFSF